MADLTSEQRQVLRRILKIGREMRASPKEVKAAVETGLVESGLRNLPGGDADSAGWRQERASLYKDPTNLDASIRRFFGETAAVKGRYGRAGELAAAVQRPAAEYRGRYQDNSNVADALLGTFGRTETPQSRDPSPGAAQTVGGVDNKAARGALVASFLQGGDSRFTQGTAASGLESKDPVQFALALRSLKDVAGQPVKTPAAAPAASPAREPTPSSSTGSGAFRIDGPNPKRLTSPLVSFARQVAQTYGGSLVGKDGSSHSKYTVNGNVSQHFSGQATDIFTIDGKPATGERLIRAGQAALIAAGMPRAQALKQRGGLYNVGSHQIIFHADGAAVGGNHMDHLHISAR